MMAASPVVHVELHTPDRESASAFYSELCGWRPQEVHTAHGVYTALALGDVGGGIVQCRPGRSLWLPYVEVANVTAATERARTMGAAVLLEPREGPGGWRSVIASPAGGEIAFWRAKR
jgi:predicted enzyme related to lactoylglutathione lyase